MGVLARSRDCDRSRPVEIHVAELVGDLLNPIWLKSALVEQNVVGTGTNGSLTGSTRDQIEFDSEIGTNRITVDWIRMGK